MTPGSHYGSTARLVRSDVSLGTGDCLRASSSSLTTCPTEPIARVGFEPTSIQLMRLLSDLTARPRVVFRARHYSSRTSENRIACLTLFFFCATAPGAVATETPYRTEHKRSVLAQADDASESAHHCRAPLGSRHDRLSGYRCGGGRLLRLGDVAPICSP